MTAAAAVATEATRHAGGAAGRTDGEPGRRNGYEHLGPLFAERTGLAEGDPRRDALRAVLITSYRPVAQHIARKYRHRGDNPDDIEQVATMGLILAVDRFRPECAVDFLSFAVPTITGEVLRYFRDRATAIRVPRRLRDVQRDVVDAAAAFGQQHGRAPRPSEVAATLGIPLEAVLEALQAQETARPASLDERARHDDGNSSDPPRLAAALGRVEPAFELVDNREALAPFLAELPERERQILVMRFFDDLTQTEIGRRVGISQMHVSRLLSRTLSTLRRRLLAD